jgi:hypothetical protein
MTPIEQYMAEVQKLYVMLDESAANAERRAREVHEAGQAVLDAFPAEVTI